jgi:enamine deaminase RidA (YjgF/YER057c/UK114 family)
MAGRGTAVNPRSTLHVRRSAQRAFLVASVPPGLSPAEAAADAYAQIADTLVTQRLRIVQERIFGSLACEADVKNARRDALQSRGIDAAGPLNYLQGMPVWGEGLAGVLIHAVSADSDPAVATISDGGVPCGRKWREGAATFSILQNFRGLSTSPSVEGTPAAQAGRAIRSAEAVLRASGMSYQSVARTWFYLADILSWYDAFNTARSAVYTEFGIMPQPGGRQLLPASTGIRAAAPGGGACSLDLLAIDAPDGQGPAVQLLRNPSQKEAFHYGSAFSRAAVIRGAKDTLIELSGTASIDEAGRSVHLGDIRPQVRCTLDKVAALLAQAPAALKDLSACTIFIKHAEHADATREVFAEYGLEPFPGVYVVADVCRDDLLFEIDGEALLPV